MGTARDIALILLSLQALIMALVPLAVLSALAYGVFRLCGIARHYLQVAQQYAQKLNSLVERLSRSLVSPMIRAHTTERMVTTVIHNFVSRRSL
ncbi:MAG: hypothetical protein JXA21_22595 [Anaerolineae bacterium]|nr:hypothetical protein [Anaerolineae bacterium]